MKRILIIRDELDSIISASKETALKDGQITTDEAQLLELLTERIGMIEQELLPLAELLEDNLTENQIRQRVRVVSREIIPLLTDVAKNDDVVTSDEAAILSRVLNTIMG